MDTLYVLPMSVSSGNFKWNWTKIIYTVIKAGETAPALTPGKYIFIAKLSFSLKMQMKLIRWFWAWGTPAPTLGKYVFISKLRCSWQFQIKLNLTKYEWKIEILILGLLDLFKGVVVTAPDKMNWYTKPNLLWNKG